MIVNQVPRTITRTVVNGAARRTSSYGTTRSIFGLGWLGGRKVSRFRAWFAPKACDLGDSACVEMVGLRAKKREGSRYRCLREEDLINVFRCTVTDSILPRNQPTQQTHLRRLRRHLIPHHQASPQPRPLVQQQPRHPPSLHRMKRSSRNYWIWMAGVRDLIRARGWARRRRGICLGLCEGIGGRERCFFGCRVEDEMG
jgi:hypothetical protein